MAKRVVVGPVQVPGPTVVESKRTGLVWACPSNVITGSHGDLQTVAVAIKIDRSGHFYFRCPMCGSSTFFSRDWWSAGHGMTPEEARLHGMTVLG